VVLTAGYILWTLQRVFLGRSETWKGLPDMDLREIVVAVPLVVLTIAMGVFPNTLVLSWVSPSVGEMVNSVVTARELNVSAIRTVEKTVPRIPESISASSTRPAVASRAGGSL
jgi:NADH-quinone oxidoreductase subunit M